LAALLIYARRERTDAGTCAPPSALPWLTINGEAAMGDEREHAKDTEQDDGVGQTAGREANAAQPHQALGEHATPERYPSVRQDDAIEGSGEKRSFDPRADAPTPRQGAGDSSPATNQGRLGPEADPAEGKRD
jgi:hypothetical protein